MLFLLLFVQGSQANWLLKACFGSFWGKNDEGDTSSSSLDVEGSLTESSYLFKSGANLHLNSDPILDFQTDSEPDLATGWDDDQFPLCRHFEDRLVDRKGKYRPAITKSRYLGDSTCKLENFSIGQFLGKGGYGSVYSAIHEPSGWPVALKFIHYNGKTKLHRLSFIRQEECLQHRMSGFPPITRHYCTFETDSSQMDVLGDDVKEGSYVVLVLELVEEAIDFFEIIHDPKGNIDYDHDLILLWTCQLFLMVREMHRRSVIFLDLKPENLLIGKDGNLKLVDFGSARDPSRSSKRFQRSSFGTAMYVPPELVVNKHLPSKKLLAVDWYCVGLILYEMVFRQTPFPEFQEDWRLNEAILVGPEIKPKKGGFGNAISLINLLTQKNPSKRLGAQGSVEAVVKLHPFFRNIALEAYLLVYV